MARTGFEKITAEVPLGASPQDSATLPARYYYDPQIYQQEMQEIFFKTWMYAGHVSQVAESGAYLTTEIGDQKVIVIKGADGEIRAFYNVCSHRGHILLEGEGKITRITCPYHAWSFASDGQLKSARGTDLMVNFNPCDYGLTPVRVESLAGFLFVNLDENAAPLSDYLPGFEEEIRRDVAQIDDLVFRPDSEGLAAPGVVASNWKLLVENFQECYHCKPAHGSLCTLFDVAKYETELHENFTSAITPPHEFEEVLQNRAFDLSKDDAQKVGRFWFIWPNLSFTSIPGTPNISIYRIDPLSPETAGNWTQAFRLEDDFSAQNEARSNWGAFDAGPEDQALCESVQQGMKQRGYTQGRIVYADNSGPGQDGGENAVHWHSRKVVHAVPQ